MCRNAIPEARREFNTFSKPFSCVHPSIQAVSQAVFIFLIFFSPALFYFVLLSVSLWKTKNQGVMMREPDIMKAGKKHVEPAATFVGTTGIHPPK